MKLSEEAQKYNEEMGDIMQDLIDDGYSKRDVVAAMNHCAELNSMDAGEEIRLFLDGVLWERKGRKHKAVTS